MRRVFITRGKRHDKVLRATYSLVLPSTSPLHAVSLFPLPWLYSKSASWCTPADRSKFWLQYDLLCSPLFKQTFISWFDYPISHHHHQHQHHYNQNLSSPLLPISTSWVRQSRKNALIIAPNAIRSFIEGSNWRTTIESTPMNVPMLVMNPDVVQLSVGVLVSIITRERKFAPKILLWNEMHHRQAVVIQRRIFNKYQTNDDMRTIRITTPHPAEKHQGGGLIMKGLVKLQRFVSAMELMQCCLISIASNHYLIHFSILNLNGHEVVWFVLVGYCPVDVIRSYILASTVHVRSTFLSFSDCKLNSFRSNYELVHYWRLVLLRWPNSNHRLICKLNWSFHHHLLVYFQSHLFRTLI